jgi:hypothetical protein
MLEESDSLALHKLVDHVAEDRADSVKPLVRLADVGEAEVVEEDLLNDEDGNCLGELRAGLHDAEAERDDLGGEEEVDDVRVVVLLYKGANDAERGEPEILERPSLGGRVEEGVEEERNVG